MDIIENRYRMIIESERSGRTISDVFVLRLEFRDKHGTNGRDAIMHMAWMD